MQDNPGSPACACCSYFSHTFLSQVWKNFVINILGHLLPRELLNPFIELLSKWLICGPCVLSIIIRENCEIACICNLIYHEACSSSIEAIDVVVADNCLVSLAKNIAVEAIKINYLSSCLIGSSQEGLTSWRTATPFILGIHVKILIIIKQIKRMKASSPD